MLSLDTHIIVNLCAGVLEPAELELLRSDRSAISAIVLWEIAKLHQLGRIPVSLETPELQRVLAKIFVFEIDPATALLSTRLDFRSDPVDELIAATSIRHNAPLVTRDAKIRASKMVPLAL
jgi:PIN domain nuclease of toxin-antitoxin system